MHQLSEEAPPRPGRRKWLVGLALAIAVVAAVLILLASGLLSLDAGGDAKSLGPEGGTVSGEGIVIEVPAGALEEEGTIEIERVPEEATALLPDTEGRGPTLSVETDQPLLKPIELRFSLDQASEKSTLAVATREDDDQMWTLRSGRLNEAGSEYALTTDQLSLWQLVAAETRETRQAFATVAKATLQEARQSAFALHRFVNTRATKPSCSAAPAGYTLDVMASGPSDNALVFACLDTLDGELAIRVVNNRAIGLEFEIPDGLEVADISAPNLPEAVVEDLEEVLLADEGQVLPAGGEVVFTGPASAEVLEFRASPRGFALDMGISSLGLTGGKAGKSVVAAGEFLECLEGSSRRLLEGAPQSAQTAWDNLRGIFIDDCGQALARAGGGALATKAAVFFGVGKLSAAAVDSIASVVSDQSATVRVKETGVGPGSSCGVVETGKQWGGPFGDDRRPLNVEITVESGQVLCAKAQELVKWYTTADNPCINSGNTCPLEQDGWTCVGVTSGSYPVIYRCSRAGDVAFEATDAVGPTIDERVQSCGNPPNVDVPGPFDVEANISCEQAFAVAENNLYGDGIAFPDFKCKGRNTGFEERETTCTDGDRVVTYAEGV